MTLRVGDRGFASSRPTARVITILRSTLWRRLQWGVDRRRKELILLISTLQIQARKGSTDIFLFVAHIHERERLNLSTVIPTYFGT
jgi:hypothetical protein